MSLCRSLSICVQRIQGTIVLQLYITLHGRHCGVLVTGILDVRDPKKMESFAEESSLEELTPEVRTRCQEEVGEKPSWKTRDIQALKDILLDDKTLMVPGDDTFALRFLRANKHDYEEGHRMVRAYYRFQTIVSPELFDPTSLESRVGRVFHDNVLVLLPNKTSNGQRVIVFTPNLWNPEHYSFDNLLAALICCLEVVVASPANQLTGVILILDFSEVSWSQVRNFGPNDARKLVHLIQDAFPLRVAKIHIINKSQLAKMVTQVIKPLANPELTSRTKLHSDLSSLVEVLGEDCLPEELGGTNGNLDGSDFYYRVFVPSKVTITRYWTSSGFGILPSEEDDEEAVEGKTGDEEAGLGSQLKSVASSHLSSLKQLAASKSEAVLAENLQCKITGCVSSFSNFFK